MKVKLLADGLVYDGTRCYKGQTIEVDEVTGVKLIQKGMAEKPEIKAAVVKPEVKKAIKKSTPKK